MNFLTHICHSRTPFFGGTVKDSEEVKSKAEMRFIHLTLLCIDTDNLSQIILSQRNALKQISQKRELKKKE